MVWPMIDAAYFTQALASASNEVVTVTAPSSLLNTTTQLHQNEITSQCDTHLPLLPNFKTCRFQWHLTMFV